MIGGSVPYDEKALLQRYSEQQIFALAGLPVTTGKFTNPLRADRHPGCSFTKKEWKGREILFFCDPSGFFGKNCITALEAVMKVHGLKTKEDAIQFVIRNIESIEEVEIKKVQTSFRPLIRYWRREWRADDELMKYFSEEILINENVHPVSEYWINQGRGFVHNPLGPPDGLIAYLFAPRVKLYFTNRTKDKWFTNTIATDIWGEYFVGKTLVITKSGKDYLTLKYICGLETIAVQSETVDLPEVYGYDNVIVLFDNDETGIRESLKNKEKYGYDYRIITLPYKDPYEVLQNKGPDFTKRYFKKLCETY